MKKLTLPLYFMACVSSSAQVVNGDFSAGFSGFSSSYTYNATNWTPAGVFGVDVNPHLHHGSWAIYGDHTTGTGKMMIVNGTTGTNVTVWEESVPVVANTDYKFSTWVASCFSSSPARLQFSINGGLLGNAFNASSSLGAWGQFSATWNSGSNTTAVIRIVNQNLASTGNDFTLDDISLVTVRAFHGRVTLLDWLGSMVGEPLQITVRDSSNAIVQGPSAATTTTNGEWNLETELPAGTYKVTVKGRTWLSTSVSNVVLTASSTDILTTHLNGDSDPNNIVDLTDYTLVATAFNALLDTNPGQAGNQSSPNWNVAADLNGDGVVDLTDYTIVAMNFNAVGN